MDIIIKNRDSIIYDKQADARKQKKQCIVNLNVYYTESK